MDIKTETDLAARGRMPIDLDGWDSYSVWFYDRYDQECIAQLWPNDANPDDDPTFWLCDLAGWPKCSTPEALVQLVTAVTHGDRHDVAAALARCAPESVKELLLGVAA